MEKPNDPTAVSNVARNVGRESRVSGLRSSATVVANSLSFHTGSSILERFGSFVTGCALREESAFMVTAVDDHIVLRSRYAPIGETDQRLGARGGTYTRVWRHCLPVRWWPSEPLTGCSLWIGTPSGSIANYVSNRYVYGRRRAPTDRLR